MPEIPDLTELLATLGLIGQVRAGLKSRENRLQPGSPTIFGVVFRGQLCSSRADATMALRLEGTCRYDPVEGGRTGATIDPPAEISCSR